MRFPRPTAALAVLLACLAPSPSGAFDETRDPWIRGTFTGHSPRPLRLPAPVAWREATTIVDRTPGVFILIGSGRSMEPLYPAGTLLVLRELDYGALRSGQTVVYRNESGRAVGHVLVARARDGWRAKGLRNATHDREPVLAGNLIGVVIAAFQPVADRTQPVALTRRPAGRVAFVGDGER